MSSNVSANVPAEVQAIVIRAKGVAALETVPAPKLRPGHVLVRTTAVALNPTDWKHVDLLVGGDLTGTRVGCDYAGVVVALGQGVSPDAWKPGDRIAGMGHGGNQSNPEDGVFAEYIVVKPEVAFKIPANISDTDAATFGVGVTTVGQGLYQAIKLRLPDDPTQTPEPVLIYGGGTTTGQLGIQFAKLSGYRVITTASPQNESLLKSIGADTVIDYHDADAAVAAITAAVAAGGSAPLRYAWDTISLPPTAILTARALAQTPPSKASVLTYRSLLDIDAKTLQAIDKRIDVGLTLAYTAFGEAFHKRIDVPARPEDHAFAARFWDLTSKLIADGKIRAPPTFVNAHGGAGLSGVLEGLKVLKAGKVHGGKLVYTIEK